MQEDCLAMIYHLSGVLADIYLSHFENKCLMSSFNKLQNEIKLYLRYVYDTFMLSYGTTRQIEHSKIYINIINTEIQFTLEFENNDSLNLLYLTISKTKDQYKS